MENENKTMVVCPVCGAQFGIAKHSHFVAGMALGEDSNLGVIHPKVVGHVDVSRKHKDAETRMKALAAYGYDTKDLYNIDKPDGDSVIGKMDDEGCIRPLKDDDDPIVKAILGTGSIRHAHLFRQHILAQLLPVIQSGKSVTDWIRHHGYEYQWKVVNDEMMRQSAMYRHGDLKNLELCQKFYNQGLVVSMAWKYYDALVQETRYLKKNKVKKCKGRPYIRMVQADRLVERGWIGIFVDEIKTKILEPTRNMVIAIRDAKDPIELHHAVEEFYNKHIPATVYWNIEPKMHKMFVDAYKGTGGYWAMQNLILFHGCGLMNKDTAEMFYGQEGMRYLNELLDEHKSSGYWLFRALKEMIGYNHFDIAAKRAEWKARYTK